MKSSMLSLVVLIVCLIPIGIISFLWIKEEIKQSKQRLQKKKGE